MKIPNEIQGVFRRYQRAWMVASMGIIPQDYCQDFCNETYEIGSDEHDECWDNCRD